MPLSRAQGNQFNDGAFSTGLFKARFVIVCSWFLFGKGQILGAVVALKVFSDSAGLAGKINIPYLDTILLVAALGAAVYAATAQASASSDEILTAMEGNTYSIDPAAAPPAAPAAAPAPAAEATA